MMTMTARAFVIALWALVPCTALLPCAVLAQTPPAQASSQQLLSGGQLDALVAPIALYPDALLSEVLMASTYPLEVVEADRWAKDHSDLKGDAVKTAVDQQSWDDSVKSLVATPDVLAMMSQKLSWTQQLGDAVLAQQPDVMDAIQRLRTKAQANNKLASSQQQTVTTQQQDGRNVIVIAPAQPDTLYVPYYDPSVVYGPWPYPAYPPYYWPAPGYIAGGIIATGIAFGAGYALGRWASGGYWGGGFNWGGNNINVNRNININNINRGNGNNWVHNPVHRQGVRYANADVAAKFAGNRNAIAGGAQNRMDFRGRTGNQVLTPGGGNRPNIDRGVNNRPNISGANRSNIGSGNNHRSTSNGVRRDSALGNIGSGRVANVQSQRGHMSLGGGGGGGGGGGRLGGGGGGGGFRGGGGGGGGGGGRGGGGRRSDIRLKHDIVLLGRLENGLGFYRFAYNGSDKTYVGVMAQEVQRVMPAAVVVGNDGYLRVRYDRLGLHFETYRQWLASGAKVPEVTEQHAM